VSNCGGDGPLSETMRKQVEERTGHKVGRHLIDGGYVNLDAVDRINPRRAWREEPSRRSGVDRRRGRLKIEAELFLHQNGSG
jgi:hypothetical protein